MNNRDRQAANSFINVAQNWERMAKVFLHKGNTADAIRCARRARANRRLATSYMKPYTRA